MGFRDVDEVRHYVGGVFEDAFADDELGPRLSATGVLLLLRLTDPTVDLLVDTTARVVRTTSGEPGEPGGDEKATATMTMSADTANAYWQGRVNLPMAMATGRIAVGGDVAALLKLAPTAKKLYPAYLARLGADGRTDLIA